MALAEIARGGHAPSERELAAYQRQFWAVLADAEALASPLSEAQLRWKPAPWRWSIAECLDHLNVTAAKYLPRMEEMVARGREEALEARGPFRHPFVGNWFIRMLEPPPRRRLRVPGVFAPRGTTPAPELLPEFRRLRGWLLDLALDADGLDLVRLRTPSPAARFLKLTLGQCFGALAAHDRRHLWQARRVRETAGFPGSGGSGDAG